MPSFDFSQMTPDELMSLAEEARQSAAGKKIHTIELPDNLPSRPSPPQDEYAATSWGSNEYDFTVPSGQKCRMRKLQPEELVGTELLGKITLLPALAQEQVVKAQGQPPTPEMPEKEQMEALIEVLNELLPIVVVKPVVYGAHETGPVPEGSVCVTAIDLADRVAILERSMQGVSKLSNFRHYT